MAPLAQVKPCKGWSLGLLPGLGPGLRAAHLQHKYLCLPGATPHAEPWWGWIQRRQGLDSCLHAFAQAVTSAWTTLFLVHLACL